MAMNHRIKRFLFKSYGLFCVIAILIATVLLLPTRRWQEFAAIAAVVLSFAFGVQKQNLEETILFKELFEQFNKRYDRMNDDLNKIWEQPTDKQPNADEIKKLFKYFNLCGEEYLYYQKGFICLKVWREWKKGMEYFRKNSRIKNLWDKDLADNDSYYGLRAEFKDKI